MDIIQKFIDQEEIKDKVGKMAKKISNDYEGSDLLVISILKGSFVFAADLIREMTIPVSVDFLRVRSYYKTESTGNIRLDFNGSMDLKGKNVLIVEDILDTGNTLKTIVNVLKNSRAKSVKTAVLLDKPSRRMAQISADYICFTIPDKFVVGYGLDYDEKYRELPYLAELL